MARLKVGSNSVLDLVHVFVPGYSLGADNVHDQFAEGIA